MALVTIHLIDRDSSAIHTESFYITEDLRESVEEFEVHSPFGRHRIEWETDDELTSMDYYLLGEAGLDIDNEK